jgi:hypothetical protein
MHAHFAWLLSGYSSASMSVSADFLRDLEEIDGSVESISTLSAYMRMHSGAAERVVGVRVLPGKANYDFVQANLLLRLAAPIPLARARTSCCNGNVEFILAGSACSCCETTTLFWSRFDVLNGVETQAAAAWRVVIVATPIVSISCILSCRVLEALASCPIWLLGGGWPKHDSCYTIIREAILSALSLYRLVSSSLH